MLGVQFDNLYHTAKDWKLRFASLEINEPEVQTYRLQVPGRNGFLDLTVLGVQFDNLYHTAKDWKLRFASLEINEPEVQTYRLQVPGRNGFLDLTDTLYGQTTYLNRSITMNFWTEHDTDGHLQSELMNALHGKRMAFIMDNDPEYYWMGRLSVSITMNFWTEHDTDGHLQSELMNALHGKRMAFIMDNDPEYYWMGRLSVHVQKNCPAITEVIVTADCEPFKQPVTKLGTPLERSL